MEKMSARQIINNYCQGRMSARPEFFSGRGVTSSDMNSSILEMIYGGILKEIGADAARNFVNMVADVSMAATTFLINLYNLEGNEWVWRGNKSDEDIAIEKDNDGNYDLASGLFSVAAAFTNPRRGVDTDWESNNIRGEFLRRHFDELDESHQKKADESRGYGSFGYHDYGPRRRSNRG